jgi:hypothetical protein
MGILVEQVHAQEDRRASMASAQKGNERGEKQ